MNVVHGLLLLCFLQGAKVEAFLSHAHLSAIGGRGRVADVAVRPFQGRCSLHNLCAQTKTAKTFSSKEFNVNWNRPDAQGTFGRVYFAKQGMMGMGGQVVLKSPVVSCLSYLLKQDIPMPAMRDRGDDKRYGTRVRSQEVGLRGTSRPRNLFKTIILRSVSHRSI